MSQLYLDLERERRANVNSYCTMCNRLFHQRPEDPPFCSSKCQWDWVVRFAPPLYWEHEVVVE